MEKEKKDKIISQITYLLKLVTTEELENLKAFVEEYVEK